MLFAGVQGDSLGMLNGDVNTCCRWIQVFDVCTTILTITPTLKSYYIYFPDSKNHRLNNHDNRW